MHRNDLFETIKWYIFWGEMHKKKKNVTDALQSGE